MVWKREEKAPQFFQKGKDAILTDKIHDAGEANLLKLLERLDLQKNDLVVSKLGRNLVVPEVSLQGIAKMRDLSASLGDEHVVELRFFGIGRRISPQVSTVDELVLPNPNKILVTTPEFSKIVEEAVETMDKQAIKTLREEERKGLFREFIKNKGVDGVDELLGMEWELISSRGRVKMVGKFSEKLRSTPIDKLALDAHTHDKTVREADTPTIADYKIVRSFSKFDWFAICKTTNIDSITSANILDDLVFFYAGNGSKPFLKRINEIENIRDENKRIREAYELKFDIYHHLRADARTYDQIASKK